MKNLIDTVNSELNYFKSRINQLIYDETSSLILQMKNSIIYNENTDITPYVEKLKEIQNIKKNINIELDTSSKELDKNLKDDILEDNAIETSGSIYENALDIEKISNNPTIYTNVPQDSYYFYNSNVNYGENNLDLNITYKLIKLEDFKLFPLKISGLKLFDNIFLGRTFRECMIKMMSFLFSLNENPFMSISETGSKYFSNSKSSLKNPVTLKENKCYIETDLDEVESAEMIKSFLNHIQIKLDACKVLMTCSINKQGESYITVIL